MTPRIEPIVSDLRPPKATRREGRVRAKRIWDVLRRILYAVGDSLKRPQDRQVIASVIGVDMMDMQLSRQLLQVLQVNV